MATLNKLNRALESLKKVIAKPPELNKQKEKVSLCLTITELVCKSNEKSTLLTFTVSSLVQLLEDADSNTRLIIDESLNKIIRASMDNSNFVAKILIALLKVLGKNSHEKCLKAALWRFSELAHFVRPQKGKIYVQTLVPIISKIAARKDESVIEVLAESLPNIFKHIGLFCSDNDIKVLLKAFLKNLHSDSPEVRRAAATSVVAICKHSRQPEYFFSYLLTILLDLLCDCKKSDQECRSLIQGCLTCIRNILPYISNDNAENNFTNCQYLLQVYELCLQYAKFHDHNVITAALETLCELLQDCSSALMKRLTTEGGLAISTIEKHNDRGSTLSLGGESDVSIGSTIARTEDGAFADIFSGKRPPLFSTNSSSCTDLNSELKQIQTEKWIQEYPDKENEAISSSLLNINTSHFANSDDEDTTSEVDSKLESSFRAMSVDNIQQLNDQNVMPIGQRNRQAFQSEKSVNVSVISNATSMNTLSIDLDIGDVIDEAEIPLHYCARFLVSAFLLENANTKKIRVSVLSLTLNSFAHILRIHPRIGNISVEKSNAVYEGYNNLLQVILSYSTHDDQQVRGLVCVAVGSFIVSSLIEDNCLLKESCHLNETFLNKLLGYLSQGLEDESSVCVKHTLHAISLCLPSLLLCSKNKLAVPILETIFTMVDNPYWLIKVKILEIIGELCFDVLHHANENSISYQDRAFRKVIIVLLADMDGRVRNAAAICLLKFVKSAYYPIDHEYEPVCVTLAKKLNSELTIPLTRYNPDATNALKRSLTRCIHHLKNIFYDAPSKYAMAGSVEAMSMLAQYYPPIRYAECWQDSTCELFERAVTLLTGSTLALNFDVHLQLLRLSSQLFVALCCDLKSQKVEMWSFLSNDKLKDLAESYLRHLIRVASVFNDVVTNVTVKSPVTLNTTSEMIWPVPIDKPIISQEQPYLMCTQNESKSKLFFKLDEKIVPITQYTRYPLYVKLVELLKSAYNNYRVTLKPESSEKFVSFLNTVIDSIGVTLNYTTAAETDRITKDLLAFLRNFMVFLPVSSVQCVVQLLRSVFGINEIAERLQFENVAETQKSTLSEGFYVSCFSKPYNSVANFVARRLEKDDQQWQCETYSEASLSNQLKRKASVTLLPSYIKFFEPSVIQSLRQYTVSSDTELQAEVLLLLSELIQLKVNYCLLDSEQVFIKFVLSQFQLIEEGQLLNIENLLPKMFNFLIHLANEKHSKPVMSVPKVIQLCDSLIASGQAMSHCILAVDPVVRYVFLKNPVLANTTEVKELETQRDVLFTMLFRLLHDPRTLKLITLVLKNSDEEEKLKRSCQIVEIIFNAIIECRIPINDDESFLTMVHLLFALHQNSFTEQHILNVLFSVYNTHKTNRFELWLPHVCVVLLYLICAYDEATLLLAVQQMLNHPVFVGNDVDPLCINVVINYDVGPEKAFTRFLCEIIHKIFQSVNNSKLFINQRNEDKIWKNKLLSEFILIISYIVKSGKYEFIKKEFAQSEYPNEDGKKFIFDIADLSNCLLITYPVIVLRWFELILALKNDDTEISNYFLYSNADFNIFGSEAKLFGDKEEKCCLSVACIKMGIFLLTCERKDEILKKNETLRKFLEFNFEEYLVSFQEPTVYELQMEIQRSSVASSIMIQVVQNMLSLILNDNISMKNLLQFLNHTCPQTKGRVLTICCHALNDSSLPVSQRAYDLVIQIIQYLSTIRDEKVFAEVLSEENAREVIQLLKQSIYYTDLSMHFYILFSRWYQMSVLSDENRGLKFDRLRLLTADKQWFFTQVKYKCCCNDDSLNSIMARLLAGLPMEDVLSVMRSQDFNNKIICHCFTIGAELTLLNRLTVSEQLQEITSDLFLASRLAILRHIEHLRSLLPRTHQIYMPIKREINKKEIQYSQRMDILFSDKEFTDTILCIASALERYFVFVEKLQINLDSQESHKVVADFAVLCIELVHWMIRIDKKWSRTVVLRVLKCCITVLSLKQVLELLTCSQIGSMICCIYTLTENYQNEVIKISSNSILQELRNTEYWDMAHSSHLSSTLIDYFICKIPICASKGSNSILALIKQLIVVISQYTSLYNYLRIPLEVWKHVTIDDVNISNGIALKSLAENFLQDKEILQNFVSRLMLIGWNNRLQFEECWMSLLIALNSLPEYESSEEEVLALSQINSVAVNAISSLLVQTLYHPVPGNKIKPNVFHLSRNKYLDSTQCKWKRKLKAVNDVLFAKINIENGKPHVLHNSTNINLERLRNKNFYGFNQISMEYLTFSCTNSFNNEEDVPVSYHFNCLRFQYRNRSEIMSNLGIDTNSCIFFLMEFYSRWLVKPDNQSVEVLIEILNSMLAISDLFTELSQFTWLLESGIVLWKKYSKDDDAICAYLTLMICKSSSIATPVDLESQKLIVKILKSGLNGNKTIVQRAALHGLLYLLESIFKKDVLEKNEIISGEYKDGILSAAILFVLENLDVELSEKFNREMTSCVISIAFYLIENYACGDNADIMIDRLCKLSVRSCKLKNYETHITVLQGFYNLIIHENGNFRKCDSVMQLVKETFSLPQCTTSIATLNLQILVAIMYSSGDFEDTRSSEILDMSFDTEKLVNRMEKLKLFFDRIKKGSKQEALTICAILPRIIHDFFTAPEILNKVILEFLSQNHPHLELMAEVVFQVFQNAIQQSQLTLIQDWVLSLLNNFIKYSLPAAVFYLNCFFVSASTNPWLAALFPFITRRNGYLEYEDRKIICISAKQFYSQLRDETQKTNFLTIFQAAEKIHPNSPFSEILKTIL